MKIGNKIKVIIAVSSIAIMSLVSNTSNIYAIDKNNFTNEIAVKSNNIDNLIELANKQLGKPYKWGASGPDSFDCSGFTYYVYKNSTGISLPRTSTQQSKIGKTVSKNNLKPGDLVFFNTSGKGISHVGLYVGNSKFIHSPSSGKNIKYDSINSSYYSKKFVIAKRVLEFQQEQLNPYFDIENHWAESTIRVFISKGYVGGYSDNTFKPDKLITRGEFVNILNNVFGLTKSSGKVFKDTENHWTKSAVDIAVTNGVCNGKTEDRFEPDSLLTREEAAVMISNYKQYVDNNLDKLNEFSDGYSVSKWAESSVEANIEKGYIGGYSDNTIKPKNNITRAESIVMMSRVN